MRLLFCPPSLPEYFVVPSSLADQDLKLYSYAFAGRRMPVSMVTFGIAPAGFLEGEMTFCAPENSVPRK